MSESTNGEEVNTWKGKSDKNRTDGTSTKSSRQFFCLNFERKRQTVKEIIQSSERGGFENYGPKKKDKWGHSTLCFHNMIKITGLKTVFWI